MAALLGSVGKPWVHRNCDLSPDSTETSETQLKCLIKETTGHENNALVIHWFDAIFTDIFANSLDTKNRLKKYEYNVLESNE